MKQLVISHEPADQAALAGSAESWYRRVYKVGLSSLLVDQVIEVREGLTEQARVSGRLVVLCQEVQAAAGWYATVASKDGLVCPTHPYTGLSSADYAVIEILERYLGQLLEVQDLTLQTVRPHIAR